MLNDALSIWWSSMWLVISVSFSCSWLCALDGCLVVGAGVLERQWGLSVMRIAAYLGLGHLLGVTLGATFGASLGMILKPLALVASIVGYSVILFELMKSVLSRSCEHTHIDEQLPKDVKQRYLLASVAALSGDSLLFGDGMVGFLIENGPYYTMVFSGLVAIFSGIFVAGLTGVIIVFSRSYHGRAVRHGSQSIRLFLIFAVAILITSVANLLWRLSFAMGSSHFLVLLTNLTLVVMIGCLALRAGVQGISQKGWLGHVEFFLLLGGVQLLWSLLQSATGFIDKVPTLLLPVLPGIGLAFFLSFVLGRRSVLFWRMSRVEPDSCIEGFHPHKATGNETHRH